jgi:DNA-directed RNA polymerase subunit beta'
MVLGAYYLTKINDTAKGAKKFYSSQNEAMHAYENGILAINAPITVLHDGAKLETSLGRLIYNEALPTHAIGFVNKQLNKKEIAKLVGKIIKAVGIDEAPQYLDRMKDVGYKYVTTAGITWSIADLKTPADKYKLFEEAEEAVNEIRDQYMNGFLTESERKARVITIWTDVKNKVAKLVPAALDQYGSNSKTPNPSRKDDLIGNSIVSDLEF